MCPSKRIDCQIRDSCAETHHLPDSSITRDAFNLREIPFLIAQRAHAARLQPALNAVQVEHVTASAKGYTETILVVG